MYDQVSEIRTKENYTAFNQISGIGNPAVYFISIYLGPDELIASGRMMMKSHQNRFFWLALSPDKPIKFHSQKRTLGK